MYQNFTHLGAFGRGEDLRQTQEGGLVSVAFVPDDLKGNW
jgi:hypothetical protein